MRNLFNFQFLRDFLLPKADKLTLSLKLSLHCKSNMMDKVLKRISILNMKGFHRIEVTGIRASALETDLLERTILS